MRLKDVRVLKWVLASQICAGLNNGSAHLKYVRVLYLWSCASQFCELALICKASRASQFRKRLTQVSVSVSICRWKTRRREGMCEPQSQFADGRQAEEKARASLSLNSAKPRISNTCERKAHRSRAVARNPCEWKPRRSQEDWSTESWSRSRRKFLKFFDRKITQRWFLYSNELNKDRKRITILQPELYSIIGAIQRRELLQEANFCSDTKLKMRI